MMRPPEPLEEEARALGEEYFFQFSEEEMYHEMSEEETAAFHDDFKHWIYEHSSDELRLYWDYKAWVGDEGQLCDGNGNVLLSDPNNSWSWIQDWDVNPEGFCLYKGTNDLILNTDGTPIKYPVLDERVEKMYEIE